jgi:hypothetical protein
LVHEDTWRLRAACVCFPSRWDLAAKIGTTLDDIHSPVPLYDQALARPTNAFFNRLTPEKSFWRLNWTLLDSPVLHQRTGARIARRQSRRMVLSRGTSDASSTFNDAGDHLYHPHVREVGGVVA